MCLFLMEEGKEKVFSLQQNEGNSGGNDYKWPSMGRG